MCPLFGGAFLCPKKRRGGEVFAMGAKTVLVDGGAPIPVPDDAGTRFIYNLKIIFIVIKAVWIP